jgi:hypothetical protein
MGREKLRKFSHDGRGGSIVPEEVSHSPGYDFRVGPWCSREGSARFGPGVATGARTGATSRNF